MSGSLNGGSIRILWDVDDNAEVTITNTNGTPVAFTVDGAGVSFPYTLSSSTTFTTAQSGRYEVSVKHHGIEIANTPDGTRFVNVGSQSREVFAPTADATPTAQFTRDLFAGLSATFGSLAGERIRRAASAASGRNSIERPVMATPPAVSAGTTNPDGTLSKTYYFTTGAAGNFAFRGGDPTVYSSIYYRLPAVTVPSGGNVSATREANGWAVEFMTDAPKVICFMLNTASTGVTFDVDGERVSDTPTAYPSTSGGSYYLLDFTTAGGAKTRRIRVEGDKSGGMRGAQVAPIYSVWAPTDADPVKAAVVGDSVAAQTGTTKPNGGFALSLGKLLGWSDVREIALGGTGWVNAGAWGSKFGDAARVADAVALDPDVLVLTGSTNDSGSSAATITAAVLAGLQAYRAALPDVPIILGGVWGGGTGPSQAHKDNETAVKAAFDQFADDRAWWVPISNDATGAWVYGTGKSGATNGSGNSDLYVDADGIHPNQAGHTYYARRWASAIRAKVLPNL